LGRGSLVFRGTRWYYGGNIEYVSLAHKNLNKNIQKHIKINTLKEHNKALGSIINIFWTLFYAELVSPNPDSSP
jgi:hypothetical protein